MTEIGVALGIFVSLCAIEKYYKSERLKDILAVVNPLKDAVVSLKDEVVELRKDLKGYRSDLNDFEVRLSKCEVTIDLILKKLEALESKQ